MNTNSYTRDQYGYILTDLPWPRYRNTWDIWVVLSLGPDRDGDLSMFISAVGPHPLAQTFVLGPFYLVSRYDITNGLISSGDIVRERIPAR